MMCEPRRDAFEQAAERYVAFYLAHMALEEREVMPLAQRVLTADDWADLDETFIAKGDPLAGHEPDPAYSTLFTRVLNLVPAPIGLGARPAEADAPNEPRQPVLQLAGR